LHGTEEAPRATPTSPILVRYADDVLALCHTRDQAEHVKQRLARWLEPRGLVFNQDETRITPL
jgi:RNA-directed DNA polymerase